MTIEITTKILNLGPVTDAKVRCDGCGAHVWNKSTSSMWTKGGEAVLEANARAAAEHVGYTWDDIDDRHLCWRCNGAGPLQVVIVGCVGPKHPGKHKAKDLYSPKSDLWKKRRHYAESTGKRWAIISAHMDLGVVLPETEIECYDALISEINPKKDEWRWTHWRSAVSTGLYNLAGADYFEGSECRRPLVIEMHAGAPYVKRFRQWQDWSARGETPKDTLVLPMEGLDIGYQKSWYLQKDKAQHSLFDAPETAAQPVEAVEPTPEPQASPEPTPEPTVAPVETVEASEDRHIATHGKAVFKQEDLIGVFPFGLGQNEDLRAKIQELRGSSRPVRLVPQRTKWHEDGDKTAVHHTVERDFYVLGSLTEPLSLYRGEEVVRDETELAGAFRTLKEVKAWIADTYTEAFEPKLVKENDRKRSTKDERYVVLGRSGHYTVHTGPKHYSMDEEAQDAPEEAPQAAAQPVEAPETTTEPQATPAEAPEPVEMGCLTGVKVGDVLRLSFVKGYRAPTLGKGEASDVDEIRLFEVTSEIKVSGKTIRSFKVSPLSFAMVAPNGCPNPRGTEGRLIRFIGAGQAQVGAAMGYAEWNFEAAGGGTHHVLVAFDDGSPVVQPERPVAWSDIDNWTLRAQDVVTEHDLRETHLWDRLNMVSHDVFEAPESRFVELLAPYLKRPLTIETIREALDLDEALCEAFPSTEEAPAEPVVLCKLCRSEMAKSTAKWLTGHTYCAPCYRKARKGFDEKQAREWEKAYHTCDCGERLHKATFFKLVNGKLTCFVCLPPQLDFWTKENGRHEGEPPWLVAKREERASKMAPEQSQEEPQKLRAYQVHLQGERGLQMVREGFYCVLKAASTDDAYAEAVRLSGMSEPHRMGCADVTDRPLANPVGFTKRYFLKTTKPKQLNLF